jgi:hypothetical protein
MMDFEMRISEHFKLGEFFNPLGYVNVRKKNGEYYTAAEAETIAGDFVISEQLLCVLEEMRTLFDGKVGIRPHGGYRPRELNDAVGGSIDSRHMHGDAADFTISKNGAHVPGAMLAVTAEQALDRLGLKGGVGMYRAVDHYIHIDTRGKNLAWYDATNTKDCPGHGGRRCTYRAGTRGAGVVLIQEKLNEIGYEVGRPTGMYDDATVIAIQRFQENCGLVKDGVYGAQVNERLGALTWNN